MSLVYIIVIQTVNSSVKNTVFLWSYIYNEWMNGYVVVVPNLTMLTGNHDTGGLFYYETLKSLAKRSLDFSGGLTKSPL